MKYFLLSVKIIFTVFLFSLVIAKINFVDCIHIIFSPQGLKALGWCVLIFTIQSIVAGYRLKPLLSIFKYKISAYEGIRLWIIGSFFSQFLISFIGGDAVRVYALKKRGVSFGAAMRSIFLDRVVGFIALQIVFILTLPSIMNMTGFQALREEVLILAFTGTTMSIMFFILALVPTNLLRNRFISKILEVSQMSKFLFLARRNTLEIFMYSFLVHFCSIVALYIGVHSLGMHISIINAFLVGIPVMLLAMLPISISGWGVREGSMVIGFASIGLNQDIALSVSIIIGIALVIVSLPGAIMLLSKDSNKSFTLPNIPTTNEHSL